MVVPPTSRSTRPDGANDPLTSDLQTLLVVSGRWGEVMARRRAEQQRRWELEERYEAQRMGVARVLRTG